MCGIYLSNKINNEHVNIKNRGPDDNKHIVIKNKENVELNFVFYRLSINDCSSNGMQPFYINDIVVMCNGEIFNHKILEKKYDIKKESLVSKSDCEIIVHLYKKFGGGEKAIKKICKEIDAEFVFTLYDLTKDILFIARDNFGIRPLFYEIKDDYFCFCSEIKGMNLESKIQPFPPGNYGSIKNLKKPECVFKKYYEIKKNTNLVTNENGLKDENIYKNINKLLKESVLKRVMSDKPIGAFLSGGLDSSLLCALLHKNVSNLHCFSIGLNENSDDIVAAKKVAKFIGIPEENHHCVYFTVDEGLNVVRETIRATETYDITTIRASVPQYLLCKWIKENTDIKVLFSGEFADELFCGYMYSKMAPSSIELEKDSKRLLEEIYLYDALRVDRTVGAFGLECRIPFADKNLVDYIFSLPASLRMCVDSKEKMLLRDSFRENNILPVEILYRKKEAFSDAVGSKEKSWYKSLQSLIELLVSDEELINAYKKYTYNTPKTKESLYYKNIFNEFYSGCENVIPKYWMPKWCDTDNIDPSATTLKCYETN